MVCWDWYKMKNKMNKRGATTDLSLVYIVLMVLVLALIVGAFTQKYTGLFSISGNEQLSRTVPTQATAGQPFNIVYTASGVLGQWGVSVEDNVAGGCTFASGKNQSRIVMLSDSGTTQTIQVNAPSTSSVCQFSGNYAYGTSGIKSLGSQAVQIIVPSGNQNANTNQTSNTQTSSGNSFSLTDGLVVGGYTIPYWALGIALLVLLLLMFGGRKK